MKKYLKILFFGIMTWLVPFLAGFLFYSKAGKLMINELFFKSIMVVVGSLTGAILLFSYFKKIKADYLREGIIVGLVWFAINIVLDLIILVPMSKMSLINYFTQIGLEYLVIPIMSLLLGYSLEHKNDIQKKIMARQA
ncbi:MAG: hypothetical protein ACOYT4_01875 [Nanoarchaeota archaeon]